MLNMDCVSLYCRSGRLCLIGSSHEPWSNRPGPSDWRRDTAVDGFQCANWSIGFGCSPWHNVIIVNYSNVDINNWKAIETNYCAIMIWFVFRLYLYGLCFWYYGAVCRVRIRASNACRLSRVGPWPGSIATVRELARGFCTVSNFTSRSNDFAVTFSWSNCGCMILISLWC